MYEAEPQLLYEKIKESLKEGITTGRLIPGQAIPSERLIAESNGVSLITAKRAVSDLLTEGFLERLPHRKGAFVKRRAPPAGAPRLIAVAIDDVRDAFGSSMLRGIEDYLWDRRVHTLICNADRDFEKVEEYFTSLLSNNVAGVIFAPVIDEGYRERNRKLVSILEQAGICYTLIDRYIPGLLANYVAANHEESSRLLTENLLERGYRKILLVRGLECTSMDERAAGFQNALEEKGKKQEEQLVIRVNDNLLGPDGAEAERLVDLVRAAGSFDCIYALNDRLLKASVAALETLGMPLDGSLPVLSYGGMNPPPFPGLADLPYCIEPSYEMGWEAAKILIEYINDPGKAIVQKVLKSKLIPGGGFALRS